MIVFFVIAVLKDPLAVNAVHDIYPAVLSGFCTMNMLVQP